MILPSPTPDPVIQACQAGTGYCPIWYTPTNDHKTIIAAIVVAVVLWFIAKLARGMW